MKRSLFCLLASCLTIVAMAVFAGSLSAQPFNYRIEYVDFHVGNNGGNSKNDDIAMVNDGSTTKLIIVGRSVLVSGQSRGFVFDHQTKEFFDVPTLLGLDETIWVGSACRAINENGIVVGWVKDVNGIHHGYWFDLLAVNPILNLLETDFPEIVSGTRFYAKDVNANGEILVNSGWVVNINNGASHQLPAALSAVAINDFGDVIGVGANGVIRYNVHTTTLEAISGPSNVADINNLGEFCGNANVYYRKNSYRTHAFRWGFGNQYDWLSDPALATYSTSLNDSGDVVGQTLPLSPTNAFLHYSKLDANGMEIGKTYLIKDLVNDAYLNSAALGFINVTERDATLNTSAPIIVGNAEGVGNEKMFILIPEELPPSLTYNSADTPKSIPDYNTTGVTSTVPVAENVTITNLTVTLNISHPRLGDLRAFLIGPNNPSEFPLNLNGVNDIGNFDGGSSQGNWRVKVVDTVRKQTGTLNGWTLTIEH